jgi:hypothetical protein
MPNQIKQATAIYLLKLLSNIFKHFLHTFTNTTLNNFCSWDYLKGFKHDSKID